jgi:hypothetical protein
LSLAVSSTAGAGCGVLATVVLVVLARLLPQAASSSATITSAADARIRSSIRMSSGTDPLLDRFEPLDRGRRVKLALAWVFGPVLWLAALVVALFLTKHTNAIEIGLLISFGMFVISTMGLIALYGGRLRQEARERSR